MSITTLPPVHSQAAACHSTRLRLPHPTLFADRAHRYQILAHNHPLAEHFQFCAALARQQDQEYRQFPSLPLPDTLLLQQCQHYELPPLSPAGWPPHPHWQELVPRLIRAALPKLSSSNQQALLQCPATDPDWLDMQKSHLLAGNTQRIPGVIHPCIRGALQVQWSALASRLSLEQLQRTSLQARCPVCGSLPSMAPHSPHEHNAHPHVLNCSLCSSSWRLDAPCRSNMIESRNIYASRSPIHHSSH